MLMVTENPRKEAEKNDPIEPRPSQGGSLGPETLARLFEVPNFKMFEP